jgi:lysozyme
MIQRQDILNRLIDEEGLRLLAYTDTMGKITIGIGCNLTDVGITKDEAIYLCNNRIDSAINNLRAKLDYFDTLPDNVQTVLIDLCFNMGIGTLLTFHNTLNYIKIGDYESAATNLLNSIWAQQVGVRAIKLSDLLKSNKEKL